MLLTFLLVVFALANCDTSLSYMPLSWTALCSEDVSPLPLSISDASRPSMHVKLHCYIPKSHRVHWKLNDLHDWTLNYQINSETTPTNRSVVYNITIMCEKGANISLPWPMKVVGLREIHVSHCGLVDRYKNIYNVTVSSISDDLRVLELRHSTWILNKTNELNLTDNLNITSQFDCGQASSLETSITSNVSDVIMENTNESVVSFTNLNNTAFSDFTRTKTKLPANFGSVYSSTWPVKPENRLMKDTAHLISNHAQLDSEYNQQTSNTESNSETEEQEALIEHIKFIIKMLNSRTKCSYNQLITIDESMAPLTSQHHFEFMIQGAEYPVLENMNYSHIGLQELPKQLAQWRIYFPNLKNLDLSHNYISEIRIPDFPSASNSDVVTFNVRHNNITVINIDILNSWASVDNFFIDIRDNPIHCGCELSSLLPLLHSSFSLHGSSLAPYEYIKELSCSTPKVLAGKQLMKLTQDSLMCPDFKSNNTAVIILGVVMVLLIVVIVIIIKFKVEIRILLYTRLHVRLPCDVDVQRSNKAFDAFVSYSNEDTQWVRENLMVFLENSQTSVGNSQYNNNNNINNTNSKSEESHKSFKLCVHQRDFIPGKTIFDNIVDSIEASRHTIIVLSPSFMRSHWAMEELRQAYRQSLVEKTRHLIVILLQKVSKDEMDPLISRCCKTFTYLEVGDSLFRDRLVFSLTTKDQSAKRRDRLAAKKKTMPETCCSQKEDSIVYDTVDDTNVCHNMGDNPFTIRPSEPTRELSNISTSSTSALYTY